MYIGNFDTDKKILIVAEIGNNHEGSFDVAVNMIEAAVHSGVDAVKFQTIVPDLFVRSSETKRLEQLKRFQFSYEEFANLKKVADREGVIFLSTPFDLESVIFLAPLVPAFKIASGDNNFYPLLQKVAETGKPIILSTGFADLSQIGRSVGTIEKVWNTSKKKGALALLHCVASYPVKPEEANLSIIRTLQASFPTHTVGYSDHTIGIRAAVAAAALGARIIEKHFTLDKNFSDFRDHKLSMDVLECRALVTQIRELECMLGKGEKITQKSELQIITASRRSAIALRDITTGSVLTAEDIIWMRPGDGISLDDIPLLLGKTVKQAIRKGEVLQFSMLE